jgi:hypothetical protein
VTAAVDAACPARTGRVWHLVIPAPAKWLNANDRYKRRPDKEIREWRAAGMVYARQAKLPPLARAHIVAELRFCDRIRRDEHNFYPTVKALIDGLVDHGLLPDDSHHYLIGPDLRHGEPVPKRPGRIQGEIALTVWEVAS